MGLLEEVGLGYLRLGQPINTLSGGESQRLKLVRHLAEAGDTEWRQTSFGLNKSKNEKAIEWLSEKMRARSSVDQLTGPPAGPRIAPPVPGGNFGVNEQKPSLFLFDEPTTGLHFHDVRALLKVFQRLVDSGHSVLVIEHNLDVIKSADWMIDLGPEAGDLGGQIVAQGTPEKIAACEASHTGRALREVLFGVPRARPHQTLKT